MAVTADQITPWSDNELAHAPAAASTTFYDGTVCFITEAGYADDDTASGQNLFGGTKSGAETTAKIADAYAGATPKDAAT